MGEMDWHGYIFLLTYMVTFAIPASLAFNIDATNPDIYTGNQTDFFGYKVLQFMSGQNKGILVTAPKSLNGSGGICKPDKSQNHQCFNPPGLDLKDITVPVKNFGLSVAVDSTRSSFTVCSPSVAHECDENSYLNSVCYKFNHNLQESTPFKPTFQDCKKKTVDLIFLFDGSESMTTAEFKKNKDFIEEMMSHLKNTSIKFAAAQFSTRPRKVFDFHDYVEGRALDKLEKEGHLKELTNTHRALRFVHQHMLNNVTEGASPDATKVVVIITDGDPTDTNSKGIIQTCDNQGIIRFVIGVKVLDLKKLRLIASEPKDNNTFYIKDYNGLTGILENFQKKIFLTEGIKEARAGKLVNEMAQSGFSAAYYKDTLILGSVGSNSWTGSLFERKDSAPTGRQINDSKMKMDSYMGYSVSVGEKNNAPLYFTGAPRLNHIGQVVVFRPEGNEWSVAHRVDGEQIGSYFGAELCTLDINSDRSTDFLLVGAPLFYHPQKKREGMIYVYTLKPEMVLEMQMNVSVSSLGRFGSTITSLADLNGDGLRDVAVGAPLENDGGGTVYIYLGDKCKGIRSTFSQRIVGQTVKADLRFFGQSIDGDIDLGEDGLTDIVVGSYGAAVVLRSKPVFNVEAHLSFQPAEINTDEIVCLGIQDTVLPSVTLEVCFKMEEMTRSKPGAVIPGMNISYTLDIDPMRQTHRGFFIKTDKKTRNHMSTHELRDRELCFNHSVFMLKCVQDTLSPVSIKLQFSQDDSETASAVLNVDSNTQADVEVPFQKNCRKNDSCVAELEVDFDFMTPTLLVVHQDYFSVSVKLTNHGDDSYNTFLTLHYPAGLSFSMMTLTGFTRPVLHSCNDLEGVTDKTTCGISLPVYRSRSAATFKTSFRIDNFWPDWNDTMEMKITAQSDNGNLTKASLTKVIPVQFQIDLAITVKDDTVDYLNFTSEDPASKTISIIYKVANLGFKAFPINVSITFPSKLEHNFEMKNYHVHQNTTQCTEIINVTSAYCSPERNCKSILCDTLTLESYSDLEFTLSGEGEFKDLEQRGGIIDFLKQYTGDGAEVQFKSLIQVNYDKQRHVQASRKQEETGSSTNIDPTMHSADIQVELIILPNHLLIILTGVLMGVMLLIILTVVMCKLGCFKRKTVQDLVEEEEERQSMQPGSPTEFSPALKDNFDFQSQTEYKPDLKSGQPTEEMSLLCEHEKAIMEETPEDNKQPL
ncbi:integrin alpha-L [Genypterus blacodes]|uniref:integrin alpha-L n=1 Tax=Genypterus blacodes TaxID=154954 RepID=UPI003F75DCF4